MNIKKQNPSQRRNPININDGRLTIKTGPSLVRLCLHRSVVLDAQGNNTGEAIVRLSRELRIKQLSHLGQETYQAPVSRVVITMKTISDVSAQKKGKKAKSFPIINAHAAGIDIGADSHWVSVPSEQDSQPVRRFGCFTSDLYALANWLKECKVETVAMESTGVYWIPLFQILETQGFEVKLVNAHHVKTVPGRKSDVLDCQWLQQLHSYGLLSGSFRPNDQICVLRSYIRQRDTLIKSASTHVQRMQKARFSNESATTSGN